jgi:adenylyltransferase/sulfurtransferase
MNSGPDEPTENEGASGPDNSAEPIWIDDEDRYSRLRMIGWWDQDRLTQARILVVGAGALGNEVLKNLALLGIGQIKVIDFDRIELSNLSRSVLFRSEHRGRGKAEVAAEMARQLNPDCWIDGQQADVLTDIGLGLVDSADVVICCVDNREARLWINRLCWKVGTPWIDGGIQEINGVAKVFIPPDGSCYECAMTENDYRLIQLRYSCPLLRREEMQQGKVPTAPTIASIIGGLQVQEALKLLHGLPCAEGSALVFNGVANRFYQTRYPRREECLSHETYDEPIDAPFEARLHTLRQLFGWLEDAEIFTATSLELDRDLVSRFCCDRCNHQEDIYRPAAMVTQAQAPCRYCNQPRRPEMLSEISRESPLIDRKLQELGIPDFDIIRFRNEDARCYVCLKGDSSLGWREPAAGRRRIGQRNDT